MPGVDPDAMERYSRAMSARYAIPDSRFHRVEEDIRKSRFIVTMAHASSVEEARAFVERIRQEHPDATHNCWAFQAGPPGSTAQVGMSDDGEPHGTAGRPMLNVLLHAPVGEVACVVTRYFGGIKLGTGGLVRAYAGMVKAGLDTLPVREHIVPVRLEVVLEYSAITLFKRLLPEYEAEVREEEFGVDARYILELPEERAQGLHRALEEMTNGTVLVELLEDEAEESGTSR